MPPYLPRRPRVRRAPACARRALAVACLALALAGCGAPDDDARSADASPADTTAAAAQPAAADSAADSATVTVLVLGNSIAAGFGLPRPDAQAFPARLQQRADAKGWRDVTVVNAGLSGETTAGGLRRLDWLLRRPIDVLVVELGGNDGLRGVPPSETRANLAAIIDAARARYPDVRVLLVQVPLPPNLGPQYIDAFRAAFPAVAEAHGATLVPFALDDVTAASDLLQDDGIHPTAKGQRRVAETVWARLEPILSQLREEEAS
jgi:acyl-CoA thioesterase-1